MNVDKHKIKKQQNQPENSQDKELMRFGHSVTLSNLLLIFIL